MPENPVNSTSPATWIHLLHVINLSLLRTAVLSFSVVLLLCGETYKRNVSDINYNLYCYSLSQAATGTIISCVPLLPSTLLVSVVYLVG